jgi:hypothetical protein
MAAKKSKWLKISGIGRRNGENISETKANVMAKWHHEKRKHRHRQRHGGNGGEGENQRHGMKNVIMAASKGVANQSAARAKYQHGVMAKWHHQWHRQRKKKESEIISGACGMATAAS